MTVQRMLTTVDNPFDPFTQFKEWNTWDLRHNYNTNQLLARFCFTSDELSEADQDLALEQAMDKVVEDNYSGAHIIVTRNV